MSVTILLVALAVIAVAAAVVFVMAAWKEPDR